ncbi:hypothetical protein LFE_2436 [Leptospirillum ferrooxidans C2-3]|uniref:Uncharacterized protein n=1 Tax=Leptospirillum ferrooxidans (strain C2-3) TaxID=1162668 RepID=I0IS58_LEPFC|nr:hypothetical protein LFE_2436 [Leptospirillum ferrooxidans C2-3]
MYRVSTGNRISLSVKKVCFRSAHWASDGLGMKTAVSGVFKFFLALNAEGKSLESRPDTIERGFDGD